jgi:streptogramin lyase
MITRRYKRLVTGVLLAASAWLLSSGSTAQAQSSRWFTEWTVPTGASEPLFARPVTDDTVFFTERLAGKLGRLNPETNAITEWTVFGFPHDLTFGFGGVFFANQSGFIGKLMPGTSQVTYWPVALGIPEHLKLAGNTVWFTDAAGRIGRLNLLSGALRLWSIPGSDPANGIDIDRTGRFIAFLGVTNVGILDTATNTFYQWAEPVSVTPGTNGHVQFSGKYLFFASNNPTPLNRLNPVTNIVRSWALPAASGIGDLSVRQDEDTEDASATVDFTESIGKIATFDTDAPGVDAPETPTVTPVVPVDSVVTPSTFGVSKTNTTVTPVRTLVTGVRTGEFVEWAVPTAGSLPGGISRLEDEGLLFTERTGNKIGLLSAGD